MDCRIAVLFVSVDPLAEKYPNKMPYHYVSNDPIMRIDPTGMKDGAGDEFKTEEAAFEDFGKEYNGLSIRLDTELRSNIYSYERDGETYFTYDRPHGQYIRGEDGENQNSGVGIRYGGVDAKEDYVPKNGIEVPDAHTHSAYEKASDDMFSMVQDISIYKGENVNGYVSTHGGFRLKYDVMTGVIDKLFDSFAYDKKHPIIKNKKNYNADKIQQFTH